ncbi:MAG: M28 family metallopeptidase [Treponema sp.]|nr:M28 family metallopeptidase [Treponema sp.]
MKIPIKSHWAEKGPYEHYFDFIAADADRYAILTSHIKTLKLNSAVITAAGNRHIFIFPPHHKTSGCADGIFPFMDRSPYLLAAHYDRVSGSPGANDNSIAVFQLLNAALILAERGVDQWIILFTDKEELKAGESYEDQGSYTLASNFKSWGIEKAKIYNFDVCGCGNSFIFSTTTDHILKNSDRPNIQNVRENIIKLRDHALDTAQNMQLEKVLLAPTPFSDDIGFLRAGLAAQTVTILPEKEADKYESLLRCRPDFADIIISGAIKTPAEYLRLPETWKSLNSAADTHTRLTPQHFEQVVRFMVELCRK